MITSNSFLGIKDLSETSTGNITTGSEDIFLIQPPVGQIYKILQIGFQASQVSAGGDGGTHMVRCVVNSTGTAWYDQIFRHSSAYTSGIIVKATGLVETADNEQVPANADEQILSLQQLYASYDCPVRVIYKNSATTDTQTSSRYFHVVVAVYKECM